MFVSFEGPEGAGKSSVLARVAEALRRAGDAVTTTREPGAGEVGAAIRAMLLEGGAVDPKAELFLFLADRAEHVAKTIRPALARGEIVLCDRYADSTLVYQAYARGLDEGFVRTANEFATGGLRPDLTLLLDIDPRVGLARLASRDRLDSESIAFHERVRDGFRRLARDEPDRWRVLDASRFLEEVAADAVQTVFDARARIMGR